MMDELRELFAKLYAVGCEHDNYAYALSDELNAEVDKAMLEAFRSEVENLMARCKIVEKTEEYTLDHMRGHMPARRFSWKKFRRIPNAAATAINDVLQKGEPFFAQGAAAQAADIELAIRLAQGGGREEPSELPREEEEEGAEAAGEPEAVAETPPAAPQEAEAEEGDTKPQKRRKTPRREKKQGERKNPKEGAGTAEKPESGNESAAELWDEAEAEEDEAMGDAE